jgi:methionyl-tRNA synthetase
MVPIWRAQYGGEAAKAAGAEGGDEPKLSRKAQEKLKKAAQKAAAEAEAARPKSEEEIALLKEVEKQAEKVRRIKAGKREEADGKASFEDELVKLRALKDEVDALAKGLAGTTIA